MITKHRVLILDDDPASGGTALSLVQRLGHDARVAEDPDRGIAVVRAFEPHLVIVGPGLGDRLEIDLLRGDLGDACLAGVVDRARRTEPTSFDYLIAKPVRADAIRQLLWHVEVRRASRADRAAG